MTTPSTDSVCVYRIDDLELDAARRRVKRGGHTIRLGKLTYELLLLLAENSPRVVTQAEIVSRLWNDRYVNPETFKQRIKLLRKALDDDAENPRYLRVVRGQGYRLIPTVQRTTADFGSASIRRWKLALAGLAAITAVALTLLSLGNDRRVSTELSPSIALLPLENLSGNPDDAYFADGFHSELLTHLTNVADLKVIARTSVMGYRDSRKGAREIGDELGVATVLTGGVRRSAEMLRVNVQLVATQTQELLWAETYDRAHSAENLFAIQSEIATAVTGALRVALLPEALERLSDAPTRSTRAWDFYLSGRDYYSRPDTRSYIPIAVEQFEQAVAADPAFALAWSALSRASSLMYLMRLDRTPARLQRAREALEHAFELAPHTGESHIAMATYHWIGSGDYDAALREVSAAERYLPGASEVYELRSYVQRRAGEWHSAVANMARAIELDPRNIDILFRQAGNYMHLRAHDQMAGHLERVLDIEPDNTWAPYWLAISLLQSEGEFSRAKQTAAERREVVNRSYLGWLAALYERDYSLALRYLDDWRIDTGEGVAVGPEASFLGVTYALAGDPRTAAGYFDTAKMELEAKLEKSPDSGRHLIALGEVLAGLGESEAAIVVAKRALELNPREADALTTMMLQYEAIVRVFGAAGDLDLLAEQLSDYLSSPGDWTIDGLARDPRLEAAFHDPRLKALRAEFGGPLAGYSAVEH